MNLTLENLTKKYSRNTYGLQEFNLELGNGILGLLGPNGAGKSTLMRIVATITRPTGGRVIWNSVDTAHNPDVLRRELGYLPQDFGVYPNLSAMEFLDYIAAIKGLSGKQTQKRIEALLDELNLTAVKHNPLGSYSGGMKQRVGIAQVLLNDPKLLLLDEPTVGLDPEERVRFRHLLSHLSGERIVILSSHIVSDIETIAGDIAIMNEGRLIERGVAANILRHVEGKVFRTRVPEQDLEAFREKHLVSNFLRQEAEWSVRFVSSNPAETSAMGASPVSATLEDAYLFLTRTAREERQHA